MPICICAGICACVAAGFAIGFYTITTNKSFVQSEIETESVL
jgi:hypothetical protein